MRFIGVIEECKQLVRLVFAGSHTVCRLSGVDRFLPLKSASNQCNSTTLLIAHVEQLYRRTALELTSGHYVNVDVKLQETNHWKDTYRHDHTRWSQSPHHANRAASSMQPLTHHLTIHRTECPPLWPAAWPCLRHHSG